MSCGYDLLAITIGECNPIYNEPSDEFVACSGLGKKEAISLQKWPLAQRGRDSPMKSIGASDQATSSGHAGNGGGPVLWTEPRRFVAGEGFEPTTYGL